MKRKLLLVLVGAVVLGVAGLVLHRAPRFERLVLTPGGTDEEARALVDRMLLANKPWLEPPPMNAAYSLRRVCRTSTWHSWRKREQEMLGPFVIEPRCRQAMRVGSIVGTPLHQMARNMSQFKVTMLGETKWKGQKVIAIEVSSTNGIRCRVGLGGQVSTSYSSAQYGADKARIWVAADTATPLFIRTYMSVNGLERGSTWDFTAGFHQLPGGLAPRAFEWSDIGDTDAFRERQEFQVVDGNWLFKNGRATFHYSDASAGSGYLKRAVDYFKTVRYVSQELEMVGLRRASDATNPPPAVQPSRINGPGVRALVALEPAGAAGNLR